MAPQSSGKHTILFNDRFNCENALPVLPVEVLEHVLAAAAAQQWPSLRLTCRRFAAVLEQHITTIHISLDSSKVIGGSTCSTWRWLLRWLLRRVTGVACPTEQQPPLHVARLRHVSHLSVTLRAPPNTAAWETLAVLAAQLPQLRSVQLQLCGGGSAAGGAAAAAAAHCAAGPCGTAQHLGDGRYDDAGALLGRLVSSELGSPGAPAWVSLSVCAEAKED